MRPLEISVILFLLIAASAVVLRPRVPKRVAAVWLSAAVVVSLLHVLFEGIRWQMALPLLLLLILSLRLLRLAAREDSQTPQRPRGTLRNVLFGFVRFVLLPALVLIAAFLPAAMTVPRIPVPTGAHGVGITDFTVRWEDREESLTSAPSDVREIVVRAWYPTDGDPGAVGEPYMTDLESEAFIDTIGGVSPGGDLLYRHVHLAKTHGHRDAPLASQEEPFPVLAFSHGYTGFLGQNTPLMEELASHGYIVFSIAHTWDGSSVFPDGRVTGVGEHVELWTEELAGDPEAQAAQLEVMKRFIESRDEGERRGALDEQLRQSEQQKSDGVGVGLSWDVWVEDRVRFFDVIEELQSGARESLFVGKLDLEAIGLLGMSFGGATAAEVCHVDARCRAAVNIDGGHMYGVGSELLDGDIRTPFLMIHSEDLVTFPAPSEHDPNDYQSHSDFYYEAPETRGTRTDVVRFRVAGTSHLHLTDLSLMVRAIPGLASRTPGGRIAEILNRYTLEFFDQHLRGEAAPLLDGPSLEFPEVVFQSLGRAPSERTRTGPPPIVRVSESPELPVGAS